MNINSCFHSLKGELDLNVKLISVWNVKYGFASSAWLRGIIEPGREKRWWLEHSKAVITCIYHEAEVLPPAPLRTCNIIPCPINAAELRSYLIHLITPLQNICIRYFIPWSAVSFMTKKKKSRVLFWSFRVGITSIYSTTDLWNLFEHSLPLFAPDPH